MSERKTRRLPGPLTVLACAFALLVLSPGAAVSDDSDCMMCHENLGKAFEATTHGRIQEFEVLSGQTGCSTCHGDGAKHMDEGGAAEFINGLSGEMLREESSAVCLTCHRSGALHDWQGSTHPMNGVGCTDCHKVHVNYQEANSDPAVCLDCHSNVQAEFQYPSHHPVREGHMTCGACHEPHGSSIGLLVNEERPSELCLTCHTHLQGPFIFEHEPVMEGCDTCHMPHGAVANNLLIQNEPFLCLQCHEMHFHAGLEGRDADEWYVPRYDPAQGATDGNSYPDGMVPNPHGTAGMKQAFATKCSQCHQKVHGTDLPSQAVPGMGRGLMR